MRSACDNVQVDISRLEPQPGDIYLLCSDGLSGMVHEPEMHDKIVAFLSDAEKASDIEQLCHVLIDAANKNGGTDNVTVVAIKVVP